MPATDAQVQQFVDERLRPRAEQVRAFLALVSDDVSAIDGVNSALSAESPTWSDSRQDVPVRVTPEDVLAFKEFLADVKAAVANNAHYPSVLKFCVRPISLTLPS